MFGNRDRSGARGECATPRYQHAEKEESFALQKSDHLEVVVASFARADIVAARAIARRRRSAGRGRLFLLAIAACGIGLVSAGSAAAAGNAAEGRVLAQTWCTHCHTISREGPAKDSAPSFPSIAQNGKPDQREARAFLNAPHPPMPDFHLSRAQIDDIVAYLNSLAEQPSR